MKYDKNNDPKWIGQRFGMLTVIGFVHKNRAWHWKCKCDCGKDIVTIAGNVKQGLSKSCGCMGAQMASSRLKRHGMSGSRLNGIYKNMKRRCYSPQDRFYKDWGGRGIKICDEWLLEGGKFFYEWALANGYQDDLSIERMDVNKDYSPDNCCWIPVKEQAWNRRTSHMIEYDGQTKCLSEWCKVLHLNEKVIRQRIIRGMNFEDAIKTPMKKGYMAERCREAGVNYHTVISRMRNHGMSFDEALLFPHAGRNGKKKNPIKNDK